MSCLEEVTEAPALSLQSRRRNTITNVDTWYNYYGIFCYIYLKKYPNDAQSLLKYGSLVRGIARSGGDFAGFDDIWRFWVYIWIFPVLFECIFRQ